MPKTTPKFAPGQAVILNFTDGAKMPATIIENIDAKCHPLTDMWFVQVAQGGRFGFVGSAITPA